MAAYVTISSNAVSDVPISFPYSFTTIHLLSTSFPITFTRLCLYFGCLMFSLFSPDTSSSGSVACSAVFLLRVLFTSVGKTILVSENIQHTFSQKSSSMFFHPLGLAQNLILIHLQSLHICLPFTESIIYIPFTTSKWDSDEGRNLCGENRPASHYFQVIIQGLPLQTLFVYPVNKYLLFGSSANIPIFLAAKAAQ